MTATATTKTLAAALTRETEKEKARLRAAMRPERLDFIDRITRQIIAESDALFQWRFKQKMSWSTKSQSMHRSDEVQLEIACNSEDCGQTSHLFNLKCFPLSFRPDEAMLRSPYQTSVEFWSRVYACTFDGTDVFAATMNTGDFVYVVSHKFMLYHTECRRALDFIFTCVLDHVLTVADPYTRERVLPRCFNSIPRMFPHAFVAHSHRWGTSAQNPLPIFFGEQQFWRTCDALRSRMQLPVAYNAVRYISSDAQQQDFHTRDPSSQFSLFHARFPNVIHAVGEDVDTALGVAIATAFPRVLELNLALRIPMSFRSNGIGLIMESVLNMHRLEHLWVASGPELLLRREREDDWAKYYVRHIAAFVKSRRGLLELSAADYLVTPHRPVPSGDAEAAAAAAAAPKAWSAYFGSNIYERQTFGIIARFLYSAHFIEETKLMIEFLDWAYSGSGDSQ